MTDDELRGIATRALAFAEEFRDSLGGSPAEILAKGRFLPRLPPMSTIPHYVPAATLLAAARRATQCCENLVTLYREDSFVVHTTERLDGAIDDLEAELKRF